MSDGLTFYIKYFLDGINYFFVIYLLLYSTFLFLSVIIGTDALYKKKREERLKNIFVNDYYVPISVIVPAYNEEVTIIDSVKSLVSLSYKKYEIIVVDDGSRDETAAKMIEEFRMGQVRRPVRYRVPCEDILEIYERAAGEGVRLTLVRKKNGGKADALNAGINIAKYPYFICIDADSVLQTESLAKIAGPMLEDEDVIAVGGAVRPSNDVVLEGGRVVKYSLPKKLIPSMQVFEYDRTFLASRILFDKINGAMIISGAFGLFKKEIVISVGGYSRSTVGEDMELVVKLHEYCLANDIPYKMKYATDAICWTQVPEKLDNLIKQRRRWHIGLFQSLIMHRNIFLNPKMGVVGFISYLYFLFFELLSPYIEVFGTLTVLLAYILDMLNVRFMVIFFMIYVIFGSVMSLSSFFARIHTIDLSFDVRGVFKALSLCAVEITALRFILAATRFMSLINYRRSKRRWGVIDRKKINIS